jgi:hypothetical protein
MKAMKKEIVLFMLIAGSTALAGASVIFNDTTGFDNWYKGSTANGTLTKGENLTWVESGGNGQEVIGRAFTATTLAADETMRLTFDYTAAIASPVIIRAGFFNISGSVAANGWAGTSTTVGSTLGTYAGYYGLLQDSATLDGAARRDGNVSLGYNTVPTAATGGLVNFGSSFLNSDFSNDGTKTYQAVLELTRNSATAMAVSFALYDGATKISEVTGSRDNADIVTSFNSVFFRDTNGVQATLDNIQVSVIPEPATIGMLGLGALIVMLIRRRS